MRLTTHREGILTPVIRCFGTKDILMQTPFTNLIDLTSGAVDLTVWVKPGADLDGRFDAICDLTGERLWVNGWMFEVVE